MDEDWEGRTEPHRAIDPNARLALHGELTGDDLVAAVWAAPESDAPRLVYGDYLLERGDPRGELIQLQLQRGVGGRPVPRERELLDQHVAAWTQPLWPALVPESIRFERGFLAACTTVANLELRDTIGHPMWSTVEDLTTRELGLVVNPCLRSLRRLTTTIDALARLAHVAHRVGVRSIEIDRFSWRGYANPLWTNDVCKVGALVDVRELVLQCEDELLPTDTFTTRLFATRLGEQIERLVFSTGGPLVLAPWEAELRARPGLRQIGSRVVRRHGPEATVVIERGPDGAIGVVLELGEARVPDDDTLRVLQSFAATPHRSLAVTFPPGDPEIDAAAVEAIRRRVSPAFREVTVR